MSYLLKHPFRLLVCGKVRSGKTTLVVNLFDKEFRNTIERLIVLCPSWEQDTFNPIRDLVKRDSDIIEDFQNDPFKKLHKQLACLKSICKKRGEEMPITFILIDDMSGSKILHGGRLTPFAQLALACTHFNVSIILITQQLKSITPAFRENLEGFISFPLAKEDDRRTLYSEYNGNMLKSKTFKKIIAHAWKGDKSNEDENGLGKNFLFIYMAPRSRYQYFRNFTHELTPVRRTLK